MDSQTILLVAGLFLFPIAIIFLQRAHQMRKAMKVAEWVVGDGQFMPLDESIIDEAIQKARQDGNEKEFLTLLRRVRTARGHRNVKVGHLYWIWSQLESGISDFESLDIPSFTKPK